MIRGIVGMEDAEAAVLCMAVDPGIKGVLIRGPPGTGKSRLVRSVSSSMGVSVSAVPLNVTPERLFGSVDLERALSAGETVLEKGLLGHDGILLVDDANLLDRAVLRQMMDSVRSGRVVVERDGLSASYRCAVSVVATANSREAPLDRATADLFDICVDVRGPTDPDVRSEISRVNLFPRDTGDDVSTRVDRARSLLPDVRLDDGTLRQIVESCVTLGVQGSRGEISAARVARSLAALDGRTSVDKGDVKRACLMCLAHRRGRIRTEARNDVVRLFGDSHMQRFIHDDRKAVREELDAAEGIPAVSDEAPVSEGSSETERSDVVTEVGELFEAIDLVEDSRSCRCLDNQPVRRTVRDDGCEGRYVSSRRLQPGCTDIAFDATVRSAAPYQRSRRETLGTDRVVILPSDLMQKVRERHTSCLFLFMVDNSGSLVIRSRMRAVKAAILSILADHYARRDSVSVMTFNGDFIGPIMAPTRSVGSLKGVLEDMPAGSMTPLSEALALADTTVSSYLRRHLGERCFVVLMTDAKANVSMVPDADPFEEAMAVASRLGHERAEWVVVDTGAAEDPEGRASRLSGALGAPYYRLDDLRL